MKMISKDKHNNPKMILNFKTFFDTMKVMGKQSDQVVLIKVYGNKHKNKLVFLFLPGPATTATASTWTTTIPTTTTTTTTTTTSPPTTTSTTTTTASTTSTTTSTTTTPTTTSVTTTTTTASTTSTTTSTTTTPPTTSVTTTTTTASTTTSSTTSASSTLTSTTTNNDSQKSERTIIIVVSTTVGGVVLCGLLAFLGLFLYRSRKSGTAKHKHSHKKKSLRQAPSSTYFYGGPQGHNTYSMYQSYDRDRNMAPRNHRSTDGEHKAVAQGNNIYSMYPSYDRNRNIGHRNPRSTDRDHKPIAHRQGGMPNHKSAYNSYNTVYPTMSYPENPQGYRSSRFLTYEYQMNEQWHRPAPSGRVHLATYYPSGRFDNDYRSEEYADSWDMY